MLGRGFGLRPCRPPPSPPLSITGVFPRAFGRAFPRVSLLFPVFPFLAGCGAQGRRRQARKKFPTLPCGRPVAWAHVSLSAFENILIPPFFAVGRASLPLASPCVSLLVPSWFRLGSVLAPSASVRFRPGSSLRGAWRLPSGACACRRWLFFFVCVQYSDVCSVLQL